MPDAIALPVSSDRPLYADTTARRMHRTLAVHGRARKGDVLAIAQHLVVAADIYPHPIKAFLATTPPGPAIVEYAALASAQQAPLAELIMESPGATPLSRQALFQLVDRIAPNTVDEQNYTLWMLPDAALLTRPRDDGRGAEDIRRLKDIRHGLRRRALLGLNPATSSHARLARRAAAERVCALFNEVLDIRDPTGAQRRIAPPRMDGV